jgi:hypothetical protein
MIVREPRMLSGDWMLIGRQEITTHGGRIELLAIAPDGSLVLIELKRDKTPRETVTQALHHASWVAGLTETPPAVQLSLLTLYSPAAATHAPLFPPRFSSTWIPPITMPRSAALHMS